MDGPNPTESKIARDEGFIIRTRMNTVNGHSDQRDQARDLRTRFEVGRPDKCSIKVPLDFEQPRKRQSRDWITDNII